MFDARDADDARNLQNGDFAALTAPYLDRILQLCRIKVRDGQADDVAQNVLLRLLGEFRREKTYTVPYRVVVNKVVDWTVRDHFEGRPIELPLPEGWDVAGDDSGFVDLEESSAVSALLERLPPVEQKVSRLLWLYGLEIDEIATQLGMTRNAVDQALWRARRRLREMFDDG